MSDQDTQDVSLLAASSRTENLQVQILDQSPVLLEANPGVDSAEQYVADDLLQEQLARLFLMPAEPTQEDRGPLAVRWACERLAAGNSPRELGNAVIAEAARAHSPLSDNTGHGAGPANVSALLAAATCSVELAERHENSIRQAAATDTESARVSAVLVVALAATTFGSAQPKQALLPNRHEHPSTALADFWQATSEGKSTQAARSWLQLAEMDSTEAHNALLSAAATRFCVDEQPLILAALLSLSTPPRELRHQLLAGVVEQIAKLEIDEELALDQRMQAQFLAEDAQNRSPQTEGRLERASNERLSALATGIARTPQEQLEPLLLASLEEGLSPEDLADTLALLRAAAFSVTSSGQNSSHSDHNQADYKQVEQVEHVALRACIAADAVRLCMATTLPLSLRYELALAAPTSPAAGILAPLAELWVPPFDSSGLADTLLALGEADPEASAEAATAIDPLDHESTDTAWCAIRRATASDCSLRMQRLVQVTALERGFRASSHPAKIWFLSAAARTAANSRLHRGALAELAEDTLS
ncbi:unannotated protein [freshwater metagenome]|uniref:Unannotated protein n=2 Tax=freshwater metagenome TaxID=449393 RepID=A0A6J6UL14_9ZZZZ|nr:hypothetical protein [Actinomycetota bacterium]MSY80106.1 hypothetical protein [Actinomycetota bacterium]